MQIGMIGLGRMGANMVQRLMQDGHECVVFDINADAVEELAAQGAVGADSLGDFVVRLSKPRPIWLMLPEAMVDQDLTALASLLEAGDIIIDGGNSFYRDDIRRGSELKNKGIHYVDVGTGGGIAGGERGYCLMICGPQGAGHFIKMVHNGIEYGIMAAYVEGFNILRNANDGKRSRAADAETTPMQHPQHYQYELDLSEIVEVWRRDSVIRSWLLDLTAIALLDDPGLKGFTGRVSDSGEGGGQSQLQSMRRYRCRSSVRGSSGVLNHAVKPTTRIAFSQP